LQPQGIRAASMRDNALRQRPCQMSPRRPGPTPLGKDPDCW
jgi:hypothetical protein